MPLLFSRLCDLLSALEHYSQRDPPLLPARLRQKTNDAIKSWFVSHRVSITFTDVDVVALLSALFPAKRSDRVYNLQQPGLARSLRRWLCLGSSRWPQLDHWKLPGYGDFSDCVERVLKQAEFPMPHNRDRVTVEQIDDALATAASRCRFSAPSVRARGIQDDVEVSKVLESIYQRLQSREAKWFTRMILKDFSSIDLPEPLILSCIDPRLRVAMQMYHDFGSAIDQLKSLPASQMAVLGQGTFTQQCLNDVHLLPPKLGVKLGPPKWVKAKGGVKHAVTIIDGRNISVERKHDGEYCQIHIDLSKGEDCVQIFSKSGKDSTDDRRGVNQAIKDGLRMGSPKRQFREKCILDGELLVYSDRTKEILDFHKIRKHVSRSGSFLGTALDSQPHHWEHLMIMFYDVMLIDDDPVLHLPYSERRSRLEKMVTRIEGRSDYSWRQSANLAKSDAVLRLEKALALAFVRRWEGLVLKPLNEPYFNLSRPTRTNFPSRWIKLKKDCIKGLGDTADFAVVGAGYDVLKSVKFNIPKLRWTHFYIGCLQNKPDVVRFGAKPHFLVFHEVSDCINKNDLKTLNDLGHIRAMKSDSAEARDLFKFEYASGIPVIQDIFRAPFVFDIAGSGFDMSPNQNFYILRFPRVMKIQWDRDWKNAVSFQELQEMAAEAKRAPPEDSCLDEVAVWVEKLQNIDQHSRGHLNSWDYSDGDDGEDGEDMLESAGGQPSRPTALSVGRRSRVLTTAPPMIRMDTGEMQLKERRLGSGEVVSRSSSDLSLASITSDGAQQTPPSSPPPMKAGETDSREQTSKTLAGSLHERTKKRGPDATDLEGTPRNLKKARSEPQCNAAAFPRIVTGESGAPDYKKSLGDITNSSHKLLQSRQTAQSRSTSDFSLVRKLPSGSEADIHQKHSKRRRIMEPSSPTRETTASASTSAATSQHTASQETLNVPSPTPQRSAETSANRVTPRTPANRTPTIQLPDLQETKIVLSPCLVENDEPRPSIKELLLSLSIPPSSFRQGPFYPRYNNITSSAVKDTAQIMLLVDSSNEGATATDLRALMEHVRTWYPISFAVWDWKILQMLGHGKDDAAIRNLFWVKMVWVPEWAGGGTFEACWRDGLVERMSQEEFDRRGGTFG